MMRWILLALACLLLGCPPPNNDGPPPPVNCTDLPKDENNCNGCASQANCGWCGQPAEGQTNCQRGDTEAKPDTCLDEWTHNTNGCPAPPPATDGIE